jgi:hypothetical protein
MTLTDLLKTIYRAVGPELEVDKEHKIVEVREKYLLSNIVENYYTLRGYQVKRIMTFDKN